MIPAQNWSLTRLVSRRDSTVYCWECKQVQSRIYVHSVFTMSVIVSEFVSRRFKLTSFRRQIFTGNYCLTSSYSVFFSYNNGPSQHCFSPGKYNEIKKERRENEKCYFIPVGDNVQELLLFDDAVLLFLNKTILKIFMHKTVSNFFYFQRFWP